MKRIALTLGLLGAFAAGASASQTGELERVKTGILPSGGFYSVYTVVCSTGKASIARLRDSRQWCVETPELAATLECFKRSEDASNVACMGEVPIDSFAVTGDAS